MAGLLPTLAGGFVSNIFKKPQTKDGFGKFVNEYNKTSWMQPPKAPYSIQKFVLGQPMTIREKQECSGLVSLWSQKWTKAQKKSLQDVLSKIQIISEPTPEPIAVHSLSASYDKTNLQYGIQKSADPNEQVTPSQIQTKEDTKKVLIFVGLGALTLFVLNRIMKRG